MIPADVKIEIEGCFEISVEFIQTIIIYINNLYNMLPADVKIEILGCFETCVEFIQTILIYINDLLIEIRNLYNMIPADVRIEIEGCFETLLNILLTMLTNFAENNEQGKEAEEIGKEQDKQKEAEEKDKAYWQNVMDYLYQNYKQEYNILKNQLPYSKGVDNTRPGQN